jgi:uncharacterized protein with PIN domain
LARRKGICCLFIDSQVLEAQLVQVIAVYGPALQGKGSLADSGLLPAVSRCPACNGALIAVSKAQARAHVPVYVWETHCLFHRCLDCGKLYWPGSHWEKIQSTLARILGHEGCDQADVGPESSAKGAGLSSRP